MLNSFETPEYIVVVTELAGIDLHRFMEYNKLSEKHVQKLTWNLLSALYYLHSHRISHRDLKPQNILLNKYDKIDEIEAKLCDFGLARNMTSETYLLTSVKVAFENTQIRKNSYLFRFLFHSQGTPLYMAPEVMDDALYDERADLWSVGCILYEALFRKPPIKTQSFPELLKWLRNPVIQWPLLIAEDSKSFLQGLLKKDPKTRLTWHQILEHPYVKGNLIILDNNQIEHPLTQTLTTSQQIRKEKQRDEIIFNRGKKMITEAMNKCQKAEKPTVKHQEKEKSHNVIGDNESISSADSINAIIQTDLETDVEGPLKYGTRPKPKIESVETNDNQNFVIKRFAENFNVHEADVAVQQNTEYDNGNLRIGTMLENLQLEEEAKWKEMKEKQMIDAQQEKPDKEKVEKDSYKEQSNNNKELERRKLSQNMENFSIRLGNTVVDNGNISDEHDKDKTKEKVDRYV